MIVKNESKLIRDTLANLCSYIVFDYWVICDTGSTDGTQQIILAFFEEKNLQGELYEDPWVDFSTNRNLALERAYQKTDYLMVFDADDLIRGNLQLPILTDDKYCLKLGSGPEFVWFRTVIVNNRIQWRYFGILHEYIQCIEPEYELKTVCLLGDYYIEARTIGGDRNRDSQKYQKDALLLEEAIRENKEPGLKSRYIFYCAQSYRDANDLPNALKYYLERIELGDYDEEIYISYMQAGLIRIRLNDEDYKIEKCLLEGTEFMKDRSECLFYLSKYYLGKKQYLKSYFYAKLGSKMKYPQNRFLFIRKDIYDFRMKELLGLASFYLQKAQKAYSIFQQLNQQRKDIFYVNMMGMCVQKMIPSFLEVKSYRPVSKQRWTGLTLVSKMNHIDLFKIMMNSLVKNIKDISLMERFIVDLNENQKEYTDEIIQMFPFVSFDIRLTEQDKFIFYIEDPWTCLIRKNYLNKAIGLLCDSEVRSVADYDQIILVQDDDGPSIFKKSIFENRNSSAHKFRIQEMNFVKIKLVIE
jgi:glycosyltransferase involved in cell wall biosynthesis